MSTQWIIFRKSTNTNSFGLRGYWEYNPEAREIREFATSDDLQIGQVVGDKAPHAFSRELLTPQGNIAMHRRALFEKSLPFKIVKHGIVVRVTCDTGKTWTTQLSSSATIGDCVAYFLGTTFTFETEDGHDSVHKVARVVVVKGITFTTETRA